MADIKICDILLINVVICIIRQNQSNKYVCRINSNDIMDRAIICPHFHQLMKRQWPTLEGRLRNAPTSELEALLQLQRDCELTEYAKKRLVKLLKDKEKISSSIK